ncbi:MAG: hypothetical protein ACKO96_07540 [Flammeovirgaceae bacterium]
MNQQKALEFIHEYLKEQEREEKSAQNLKFEKQKSQEAVQK